MHRLCIPREIKDPLFLLNEREEIRQEPIVGGQGGFRADDDQLLLGSGKRDVDPSPVAEQFADLQGVSDVRCVLWGTHAAQVVGSHHRDDDTVLVPALTLVGRQDLDRFHIL